MCYVCLAHFHNIFDRFLSFSLIFQGYSDFRYLQIVKIVKKQ